MPTAITQRDRITASANLDISEMDGVVQVNSILLEASGFSYARPRYRNPRSRDLLRPLGSHWQGLDTEILKMAQKTVRKSFMF